MPWSRLCGRWRNRNSPPLSARHSPRLPFVGSPRRRRKPVKSLLNIWAGGLCAAALLPYAGAAPAETKQIKVKPGELVIDPPTLINLGFEWVIEGDDNRNAKVEVSYRKQGEAQWRPG